MPTIKQLIRQKSIRLKEVPDALLTEIEKIQKKIFSDLITILDDIDKQGGFIKASASNIRKLTNLSADLKSELFGSDYVDAVTDFAKEFNIQKTLNDEILKKEFSEFTKSELAEELVKKSQEDALQALLGSPLDTEFLKPLDSLLSDSIATGASWKDTVTNIRDFVEGNEDADGRLLSYAKQISHDNFAYSDRSYTNAVADEIGVEWYLYSGAVIPTSRCFCIERHQKYFHYKEIEAFGRGEDLGDCKVDGLWAGADHNTNEKTIFMYAGGHNCNHDWMPVSVFSVPKDVIERNISSGNYSPSEAELELVNG